MYCHSCRRDASDSLLPSLLSAVAGALSGGALAHSGNGTWIAIGVVLLSITYTVGLKLNHSHRYKMRKLELDSEVAQRSMRDLC